MHTSGTPEPGVRNPGRDLPYKAAADPHWAAAGSTRLAGPFALPDRRPTRSHPGVPVNLTVYDLAADHDTTLADFAREHGRDATIPAGRTALAAYAADLAASSPEAAADYEVRQLVASLRVAMALGDADDTLGRISCPKCLCWSLLATTTGRIVCWNVRCAHDPDPSDTDEDADAPRAGKPRSWSLTAIARHHLYGRHAA